MTWHPLWQATLALITALRVTTPGVQDTEQDKRAAKARSFIMLVDPTTSAIELRRMKVSRRTLHTSNAPEDFWSMNLPFHSVTIDVATGQITGYSKWPTDRAIHFPPRRIVKGITPLYKSKGEWLAYAARMLSIVGWQHGPEGLIRGPMPPLDIDRHQFINVMYCDRPHGYSTHMFGNYCLVGFDPFTGQIEHLERKLNYRYGPADVRVGKAGARICAGKVIELGPSPVVDNLIYSEVQAIGTMSVRGKGLYGAKELALGYWVRGASEMAFVAADTGEVLQHFRKK